MNRKRLLTATVGVSGLLAILASPASAVTAGGYWPLNESSGSVVHDTSGNGNNGNIVPIQSGTGAGITKNGNYFTFTGKGHIEVPSASSLNPGTTKISWSAEVRMTSSEGNHDSNIVQKGLIGGSGGQYKLEQNSGVPDCYARDSTAAGADSKQVFATGVNIADNTWHKVTCTLSDSMLKIFVDGTQRDSKDASLIGTIANQNPLTIGGKEQCTDLGCDQYFGDMMNAFVSIG